MRIIAVHWLVEVLFPRRLHRLAYFLRSLAVDMVASFLYTVSTTMAPPYWWTSLLLLLAYAIFFILLPRLRDAGMSAWWILAAVLVPVAGIVLGVLLLFRAPEYPLPHAPKPAV